MALTNAEKQAAWRRRQRERLQAAAPVLPSAPVLEHMPATRRWQERRRRALDELRALVEEMQAYADGRSEQWQDSERGQAFCDRLSELESVADQLDQIDL